MGQVNQDPAAILVRGSPTVYGYGDGDGYGYSDGYGYGYGYGDGYSDGYGYGDGYGYSDGYGDGDGDGDGYGYGYGSKEYWLSALTYFAAKWASAQRARLTELQKAGATIAYWRSDKDGRAANGGHHSTPVCVGHVEKIAGPLQICTRNGLHATLIPPKWKGERWWIVALIGEVQWEDDKCAALEREILGECL